MRTIPFKNPLPETKAPAPEATQVKTRSFESSIVRDLGEEIARPVAPDPKPEVKPEQPAAQTQTTAVEQPNTQTTEPSSSSATMTADMQQKVDKFKETLGTQLNETVSDPKRAAKHALHIINLVRFFAYPWLYKKILFTPFEVTQIETAQKRKAAELSKKDGKFEPTEGEKAMLDKWDFFQKQAGKVSWSKEEIDLIAEVGYLKLAEIQFIKWLMQNEWMIVILIIEGPRWAPVAGYKMGFGEMDISGLSSILKSGE